MQYQFNGGPTLVNAYRLTGLTGSSATTRDPKAFALMGSHNGADWVTLHSQAGVTSWASGQQRFYAFPNDTAYAYYRFTISANNGDGTYTGLNELEFFQVPSPPAIENLPASNILVDSGWMNGSLTVTGTAATAVMVYWGSSDGGTTASAWANTNVWAAPQQKGAFSHQATGFATNDTCYYRYAATNDVGLAWASETSAFITGEVWIEWVSDGAEEGLMPGSFRVVRSAATTEASLSVLYAKTGGTAESGVDFAALSGQVVIPAGQTSAQIAVTPIGNYADSNDKTVTLSILPQGYLVGTPAAATLTIANYDIPSDKNVWVAPVAGNASVAANWSQGVPTSADVILLDVFSTADMTWDAGVNGLPDTVAAWTQTADYTGTVTFNTTYPDAATVFTNFTVSGNAQILGGKWMHQPNATVQSNRLCVAVGGDFTLGSGATFALLGKGFQYGKFHAGSAIATHAASPQGNHAQIYGDVYKPTELGSGGDSSSSARSYGGGAVYLVVAGSAVVDGTIDVRSSSQKWTGAINPEKGCGAGGSVYLSATSISGAGSVNASCYDVAETSYSYNGSGGRVALIARTGTVSLPLASLKANGGAAGNSAGGGTIFIKNAADANGTLLVGNNKGDSWSYIVRHPKKTSCTAVRPGETWTFDRILLRDQGILSIPATATLGLAGGWNSVSNLTSTTDPMAGVLHLGGTLDVPAAAEHQIAGRWIFQGDSPYTFDGDVRISNYAAFGNLLLAQSYPTNAPTCDITVNGDLSVTSSGLIYGPGRGIRSGVSTLISYHGGIASASATTLAYDSILNPVYPGNNGQSGDAGNTNPGGGTVKVTVAGTFTHDGVATVAPVTKNSYWNRASGGTLNITAAFLEGSGSMTASGTGGSSTYYSGAGGRVAVRLTGAGATFDAFGAADINAKGGTHSSGTASLMASAGTVYLQSGTQAEGAGTLIVRNTGHASNTAFTPIPSTRWGGEDDVLDAASLSIEANARVKLAASLKMQQAAMSAGTLLDLAGKTLVVRSMTAGGAKVAPGTYAAGSTLFTDGYVVDSVGGGQVLVLGAGTVMVVR